MNPAAFTVRDLPQARAKRLNDLSGRVSAVEITVPRWFATRADVSALATPTDYQVAYLLESPGTFVWYPGDYSAQVAIDTLHGIYLPPNFDPSGRNGCWIRKYDTTELNLAWWPISDGGDAAPAAQIACNLLGAKGGAVKFPAWEFLWSASVYAYGPVLLRSDTIGDVSTNTNGGAVASARPIILWTGGTANPMFTIKPAVAGQMVFGGGSEGLNWDGNHVASCAVVFDNNIEGLFDGDVSRCTVAGVDVCSDSGAANKFSQTVRIRRLNYVWGTLDAAKPSHGLRIRGNGATIPTTQHQLGEIRGLVYDGNLVDVSECDNLQANKVHGVVQSGGAGNALWLHAGGAQGANNNLFRYVNGKVREDAGLRGNIFDPANSEAGGINSGSVWHGTLRDYQTGRLYQSHRYKLQKKIQIPSGAFIGDAATGTGNVASLWRAISLVDAATSSASVIFPPDMDIDNGTITGVEVAVSAAGASAGNYRIRIQFGTDTFDVTGHIVTPQVDDTSTYAAGANNQIHKLTLTFATPVAFTKGNLLCLRVQRIGADAADTNTDAMFLCGARLLYTATGPTSAGSGTYTVPDYEA